MLGRRGHAGGLRRKQADSTAVGLPFVADLDTPLLQLAPQDYLTLRSAVQGISIFGGIGSGKTSSAKYIASAYLRAGFGGLVLACKAEEVAHWRRLAAENGRSADLIEFGGPQHGFNFLSYELARQGVVGLNSVVECLMRVVEASRLASANPGRAGEAFWEDTTRQLLRNTIPVLYAATGTVRIEDIVSFVRGAPRDPDQFTEPQWQQGSFMFAMFAEAHQRGSRGFDEVLRAAARYWRDDFAVLDPKTKGNIAISLSTTLDRFNHGRLRQLFCARTTVAPEMTFHGAIILLNMPALTWNEDGVIGQQLFKYMWQRAVLSRNALAYEHQVRPVFLWADEAQYFVNSYDAEYQSTCRGSRACTVYLTQSLPTYYARMAGENARDRTHHFLGNFATKVFYNNACAETNEYAARLLGRVLHRRATYSEGSSTGSNVGMNSGSSTNRGGSSGSGSSYNGRGGGGSSSNHGSSWGSGESWGESRGHSHSENVSHGYSEQMDYVLQPDAFSSEMLKTGGPEYGNKVSAVWFQAGRRFAASGDNALLVEFRQ